MLFISFIFPAANVAVGAQPQNQTVNELQVFVFPCLKPAVSSLPTWIINEVHYFPSELPPNYYVNETGLVGVATAEMNQSTYQCVLVTTSFDGMTTKLHTFNSTPAVLTVIQTGEWLDKYKQNGMCFAVFLSTLMHRIPIRHDFAVVLMSKHNKL